VHSPGERPEESAAPPPSGVAELSQLYLGNILFALERCALALEGDGRPLDAAFYRGIGRKLAHGKARSDLQKPPLRAPSSAPPETDPS
jgi:hypothetical protein